VIIVGAVVPEQVALIRLLPGGLMRRSVDEVILLMELVRLLATEDLAPWCRLQGRQFALARRLALGGGGGGRGGAVSVGAHVSRPRAIVV
jgi:hypothetical protein